jgi:hypothetical protein
MRTTLATLGVLGLLMGCERRTDRPTTSDVDPPPADTATPKSAAVADTTGKDTLDWRPAPPGLPAGARGAVVAGDPSKPGPFTIRMDMPAGYQVMPHHHPKAERVRVLEGSVMLGHGKKWLDDQLKPLAVGEVVTVDALRPHFVQAKERTLLEVRSNGPFVIIYENPADDPRKAPIQ